MQTSAKAKISTESDQGFEQDFKINPDVCRIALKMLRIPYHFGISHFAECRENQLITGWEILINLPKSLILLALNSLFVLMCR